MHRAIFQPQQQEFVTVPDQRELPFHIERLGVVMDGDSSDPNESWGVLNPASARSRDGELYLFPRVVADKNLSRVGVARVLFDGGGDPCGVERLGYALEPTESYERNPRTGGCEDPRITFVRALDTYVMTYTAYGPLGPRIAMAISTDLMKWQRLGLVKFAMSQGTEFDFYHNKDAVVFPELLPDPQGRLSLVMIHRPDYNMSAPGHPSYPVLPDGITETRPSMWISYSPVERRGKLRGLNFFHNHNLLATPDAEWQALKVGAGTPPVLTRHGWLLVFHGVSGQILEGVDLQPNVHYSAGAMILDRDDPRKILYRSSRPILAPTTTGETQGLVNNVVFPTAVDERNGECIDVYYGMADSRIGVGRLQVPEVLALQAQDEMVA
ncbi:MAG: glycosidase [Chloroflexia bacterium]|nr:glycosidase [Chloroflexia bacterium]